MLNHRLRFDGFSRLGQCLLLPNLLILPLDLDFFLGKLHTCKNSGFCQSQHSLLFISLNRSWGRFWPFISLISVFTVVVFAAAVSRASAGWSRASTSVTFFRFPRRVWIRTIAVMLSTFLIAVVVFPIPFSMAMGSWTSLISSLFL